MDERLILSAITGSRKAFETFQRIGADSGDFSETGACVIDATREQYSRDADAKSVSRDLLRSQVERRFGKGSMADSIMEFVDSFPSDASGTNITEEYRLLRLGRTASTLATLLASGQHGDTTQETLDVYKSLVAGEEGETFKERLTEDDFAEDDSDLIMLHPALKPYIGRGVKRGHNITIFGRPNSCKSMLALDIAANGLYNGHKVLYVANEEPAQDITLRLLARLTGIALDDLKEYPEARSKAFAKARDRGYERWTLLHKGSITARDIQRQMARLNPDIMIVDQLKNVQVAEDNRALQLDKLARQVRELGIDHEVVTVSVTQAGESAEGKLILGMTDVEWSNTGIPGAADLMIGIGVNHDFLAQDKRMLCFPKNKIMNKHGEYHVWIDVQHTKISARAP